MLLQSGAGGARTLIEKAVHNPVALISQAPVKALATITASGFGLTWLTLARFRGGLRLNIAHDIDQLLWQWNRRDSLMSADVDPNLTVTPQRLHQFL
ncbi:hypothetical protein CVAR292_02972 [Corynebacterium variabile]|uniref:Uncharacterized protein n=1 Tax=Corynebacterium variabile TaxID=1727 RepID=A0A120N522_9CORY|nr:hypothetical protein CVAR292_02972 [Corynebacterium variabile]